MNKKAYQSPNITILGGVDKLTLGKGNLNNDNNGQSGS